jgi:hypothetical protein
LVLFKQGTHELQSSTNKTLPAKSRGRKNPPQQPTPTSSASTTQFGLTGYSSAPTYTMTPAFYSIQSQISQNTSSHIIPNPTHTLYSTNVSGNHSSYQMPPAAASTFLPVMYWPPPPPTAYFTGYYPSTFGYRSFPSTASYMSFQTRPYYYNHPTCNLSSEKLLEGNGKNESGLGEIKSDTDSNSGGCTELHKQGP